MNYLARIERLEDAFGGDSSSLEQRRMRVAVMSVMMDLSGSLLSGIDDEGRDVIGDLIEERMRAVKMPEEAREVRGHCTPLVVGWHRERMERLKKEIAAG